jgi:hypothetical protein
MKDLLTVSDVAVYLTKAEESFRHQECAACECYLGYLTQLEIDSDQEAQEFLKNNQPAREEVHACLGCDPCPPGILYANYLRKRNLRLVEKSDL